MVEVIERTKKFCYGNLCIKHGTNQIGVTNLKSQFLLEDIQMKFSSSYEVHIIADIYRFAEHTFCYVCLDHF